MTKQTWYDIADVLERFRAFPIIMMLGYGVFVWEVFAWIRSLDNVGVQEAGIFGAIIANAGFVFNFYTNLVAKSSKVE